MSAPTPEHRNLWVWLRGGAEPPRYWLTRFLFLRLLGFIYAIAFLVLLAQMRPLIGEHGLYPVQLFLDRVAAHSPEWTGRLWIAPTLFWLDASDAFLQGAAVVGLVLSLLVLFGLANVPVLFTLWALYLSFVNIGQLFYGYGWETLLLETGFLAIFLVPVLRPAPFPWRLPPPTAVVWLMRWLAFRVMFGAGLIKLRGDPCWRDLTCLAYHYETQPLPNPMSWYLHHMPLWFQQLGVLWNHFIEICVPWLTFGPRRVRHGAGVLLVTFQGILIVSGNLSWLNWLTIGVCLWCFDDRAVGRLFPRRLRDHVRRLAEGSFLPTGRRWAVAAVTCLVALLSIQPAMNLISPHQLMNSSFDPLSLVNTYGAFGGVGRERNELVILGTDADVPSAAARWKEYELPCKPGDPGRAPCFVAPYHLRLDWQIWFAAMGRPEQAPWLVHLLYQLLAGEPDATRLLAGNPFPERPPRFVRVDLYRYQFTEPGQPGWWRRTLIGPWLPPLSLDDPGLLRFIRAYGWIADDPH